MRLTKIVCSAGLTLFALAAFVDESVAQSYPDYRYCANYGGRRGSAPGTPVCGFNTREQCLAAVSGSQGYCEINPWYVPPGKRKKTRTSA